MRWRRSRRRSRPPDRRSGSRAGSSRPTSRLGPSNARRLRELLARAAERVDVRVLAWAGAPLPLFHPDRSEVREPSRDALTRGTRIQVALDARERPIHCHHEKLVDHRRRARLRRRHRPHLVRRRPARHERASCPRLDRLARRDDSRHRARPSRTSPTISGSAGGRSRARSCRPRRRRQPAGEVELQIVRTVPEKIYRRLPRGEFTILESYLRALRAARAADLPREPVPLVAGDRRACSRTSCATRPTTAFRLLVLLPAKPNNGNDDTRGQLGVLAAADDGAGRFLACTLSQAGDDAPPRLRARQDRDRRRPLADDRLGEPERALALQRHAR